MILLLPVLCWMRDRMCPSSLRGLHLPRVVFGASGVQVGVLVVGALHCFLQTHLYWRLVPPPILTPLPVLVSTAVPTIHSSGPSLELEPSVCWPCWP